MVKFIEVITTFESADAAKKTAKKILEKKLGACCSIEKIESLYRWNDKTEQSKEFKLTIKTVERLYSELEAFIVANHTYDTPQIVSLPILGGSDDYLGWVERETR